MDKPKGISSAKALSKTRRLCNVRKAGHGGTLDPLASGVLPIAFGEATKLIPYLMDEEKEYDFTACFGEARSTDDGEGEVIRRSAHIPSEADIISVLPQFTGEILQRPPAFSAAHIDGRRAYQMAREGHVVELAEREISVFSLTLTSFSPPFARFHCVCSKGTYIRSLARNIAETLGSAAYVSELIRRRVGKFSIKNAISLAKLEQMRHSPPRFETKPCLIRLEEALDDIPALSLNPEQAGKLRQGQNFPHHEKEGKLVIAMEGNTPIAIARVKTAQLYVVRGLNVPPKMEKKTGENDVDIITEKAKTY